MATKEVMSLSIPREVRAWIVAEAGKRRMSISEYMLVLLTRGIQADTLDQTVARIEGAVKRDIPSSDVVREVLELRYLVEQLVKKAGADRVTQGTDAAQFAENEMVKRGLLRSPASLGSLPDGRVSPSHRPAR